MRVLVKRYFRARWGFWEPGTFKHNLKQMLPFFFALGESYPEMEGFTFLTRPMIEPGYAGRFHDGKAHRSHTALPHSSQ